MRRRAGLVGLALAAGLQAGGDTAAAQDSPPAALQAPAPAPEIAAATELATAMAGRATVLLGEIHDNPRHHRLRLEALRLRLAAGWRPALVMEQFDRERQPDLDRARLEQPGSADHVIAAATAGVRASWLWAEYRPFVQLALDYDLPLLAGNVSRADLARIRKEGPGAVLGPELVAALGLDRPIPGDIVTALEKEIDRGHCYRAPPDLLPGLARSQVIRDAWMAHLLRRHAAAVVLLAGNGHVRRDYGVPRWLPPGRGADLIAVGLLEAGQAELPAAAFDRVFTTPPAPRPDPCAAFATPPGGGR